MLGTLLRLRVDIFRGCLGVCCFVAYPPLRLGNVELAVVELSDDFASLSLSYPLLPIICYALAFEEVTCGVA